MTALPPFSLWEFLILNKQPIGLNDELLVIKVNMSSCPSHSHECHMLSGTSGWRLITSGTKDSRLTYLPRIL